MQYNLLQYLDRLRDVLSPAEQCGLDLAIATDARGHWRDLAAASYHRTDGGWFGCVVTMVSFAAKMSRLEEELEVLSGHDP